MFLAEVTLVNSNNGTEALSGDLDDTVKKECAAIKPSL